MTAPNYEVSSLRKVVGDGNPDGSALNLAKNARSNPMQAMIQGANLGSIISYAATIDAASCATIACANTTGTVTGLIINTDMVIGVSKTTANAGWGIGGLSISGNDTLDIQAVNPSTGAVNPASDTFFVTAVRGLPVISANLVPAAVVTKTVAEQVFTLAGSGATATASVVGGGVSQIDVTAAGVNYYVPPTVIITPAAGHGGAGASGVAIIAAGTVVGVQVTAAGSGYDTAPTISFATGTCVAPGMMVVVSPANYTANVGMGSARVVGPNQIGITYVNPSAANVTPTANVAHQIFAFNEIPAVSPIVRVSANVYSSNQSAANAANITTVPVPGVLAMDIVVSSGPVAAQTGGVFAGGTAAADSIALRYMGGGNTQYTPSANVMYSATVLRPIATAPAQVNSVLITPTSVAANTTAEQIFTLPSNVTLQASTTVIVNKPSFTSGIAIVGARANSTTTIGITFYNGTSGAIVPPAEDYLIANFPALLATLGGTSAGNATEASCIQACGGTFNALVDLSNEEQQSLVAAGVIKGY